MSTIERNRRKLKEGTVISNKMDKTVVVRVATVMRHPQFGKVITRYKKFYAHAEGETIPLGSVVSIMETRPMSRLKRWRVVETLSVPDVQ
jgi:small subunit ribosomal protein S17